MPTADRFETTRWLHSFLRKRSGCSVTLAGTRSTVTFTPPNDFRIRVLALAEDMSFVLPVFFVASMVVTAVFVALLLVNLKYKDTIIKTLQPSNKRRFTGL